MIICFAYLVQYDPKFQLVDSWQSLESLKRKLGNVKKQRNFIGLTALLWTFWTIHKRSRVVKQPLFVFKMHKLDTRLLLRYVLPVDPYSIPAFSKQPSPRGSNWKKWRSTFSLTSDQGATSIRPEVAGQNCLQVTTFCCISIYRARITKLQSSSGQPTMPIPCMFSFKT